MSLKQKTISGLSWSFINQIIQSGIAFIVGIILARLLAPEEFGLIGMITIFIAISITFVNSGFSQALIQKRDCTDADYSTVFYFNLIVGFIFYTVLFFSAPLISFFFKEPQLTNLIRVLALALIIDSISIIQRTLLTKRIDFKLQTKISIIASVFSGILAVILAYNGFGVWSLVVRQLSLQTIKSFLLWYWNRWRPITIFSKHSFNQLFSFGSKLLISGLIDTAFRNVYYVVIGKYYLAADLGFYTRAENFKNLPSQNLTGIIQRVSYPVLSSIQDDIPRLKNNYQRLIRSTMFLSFILSLGMAAVAKPMIITLIGEKWLPSVIYLQMLCFVGMLYPLHALNLSMLKVQGRSDLFLKLEIIKKCLAIPVIIIGVFWGIKALIAGMIFNSIIAYLLNSYWSGKMIGYSTLSQIRDIFPSFVVAVLMASIVFMLGTILQLSPTWILVIQLISGATIVYLFCELIQQKDFLFLKELFLEKLNDFKNSR